MTTKNYLLLLFFGLMSWQAAAQEGEMPENYCGDVCTSLAHLVSRTQSRVRLELRGADTTWLYVPVTVHLVGNDNGFGYYPTVEAIRAGCQNESTIRPGAYSFLPHARRPFVSHNSTEWNDHDWQGGADLIQSTCIPGRLNAYIVSDPAGNCGYSWHDAIVLSRNCSGPGNSTWAHEAGHHLSLPHPFFGWEGEEWD